MTTFLAPQPDVCVAYDCSFKVARQYLSFSLRKGTRSKQVKSVAKAKQNLSAIEKNTDALNKHTKALNAHTKAIAAATAALPKLSSKLVCGWVKTGAKAPSAPDVVKLILDYAKKPAGADPMKLPIEGYFIVTPDGDGAWYFAQQCETHIQKFVDDRLRLNQPYVEDNCTTLGDLVNCIIGSYKNPILV